MTDIVHKLVSEMSTKFCVLEMKPGLVEGKKYLILLRSDDKQSTQWEIGDYYPERRNYMGHGRYEKEPAYFSDCAGWEIDVSSPHVVCWLDLPSPKQIETLLATKPIVEG